jgi:hypothetical protein
MFQRRDQFIVSIDAAGDVGGLFFAQTFGKILNSIVVNVAKY